MKFYLINKELVVSRTTLDLESLPVNTVDASVEKHVPVVEFDGDIVTVKVGEVAHPMLAEHWISDIVIETTNGYHHFKLNPTDEPMVSMKLDEADFVKAFEYCNLHGLWSSK